jgi:predicted site-specific integrase-resolvase
MSEIKKENENLVTLKEAAYYLGVSYGTLRLWRCNGRFDIPYIQYSKRKIFYHERDVRDFLKRHEVLNRND